ncbi:MAG: 16S rRNA (guanine(527)-N(7))-methyltransferase RsmG [Arenicellales bacterium]
MLHKKQQQSLSAGIEQLALEIPQNGLTAIEAHLGLVQRWQSKINLISTSNDQELITHHGLDSLAVLPLFKGAKNVLDFGTGAGFPGMPLAAAMPDTHFTLLDSRGRRVEFLRMVAVQIGLKNVELVSARVEQFVPEADIQYDTLVVRAVASLLDLVDMTNNLRCKGQRLIAMKGQYPQAELDALGVKYADQIVSIDVKPIHVPFLDAERHAVIIQF